MPHALAITGLDLDLFRPTTPPTTPLVSTSVALVVASFAVAWCSCCRYDVLVKFVRLLMRFLLCKATDGAENGVVSAVRSAEF